MASDSASVMLGISLGCTNACVAVYRDGSADVVANDAGDRVTPCVTTLSGKEKALRVATRQELSRQTSNLIVNARWWIGRKYEQSDSRPVEKCQVVEKAGLPFFELSTIAGTTQFTPVDALSAVFTKIQECAQAAAGGAAAKDCVISVPASFNDEQCAALCKSAEIAGLNVLRLVNDPVSALLAYGVGQTDPSETFQAVVYDLGGSACEVSVVEVTCGLYRILATVRDEQFGGKTFDGVLIKHFATEFKRQFRQDLSENARAMTKLHAATETARRSVSSMATTSVMVESLYDGMDFNSQLSRARFDGLCSSLWSRCLEPVQQVLHKANLEAKDISTLVLAGGASRMPKLRTSLSDFFLGKAEVLASISPEEVVAAGACLQAGILGSSNIDNDKNNQRSIEMSCTSRILAVAVLNGEDTRAHMVVPQYTPVPVRRKHLFSVPAEQDSVLVTVYECDQGQSVSDATPIAELVLNGLPEADDRQIEIVLQLKSDGSVVASARDLHSAASTQVVITNASDDDDNTEDTR